MNPGIYILIGEDFESGEQAAYIGEAEIIGKRLKGHQDKDFWIQSIAFVSKDENLTKAHIKYLEGELIKRAQETGKAKLINSQSSGAKLPESDEADMKVFLNKVYQLLPILGTSIFEKLAEQPARAGKKPLTCKIKGLVAKGRRTSNGFLVFKDSQAVGPHRKSAIRSRDKREELKTKGILIPDGKHLIFSTDFEFSSPSAAASVIRGGQSNGLTSWKDESGKTLKRIEQEI